MNVEKLKEIIKQLQAGGDQVAVVHDLMVGRDSHPLWDNKIHGPFEYFVALETTRILDQINALTVHCHNYLHQSRG